MVKIFDIKAFDKQPISRVCQASISRIVCVLEHSPFDVSCLAPTTANADNTPVFDEKELGYLE